MAFSFYSSLKSIPREMREAAKIYRFNWYQRFTQIELAVRRHRPGVELDDVGRGRLVLPDGLRDVRARLERLSPARTRLVPADGGQRRRHRGDSVGRRHHDRRHRPARPDRLASGDRLGREVQDGAGGKHRRAAVLVPRPDRSTRDCWCACASAYSVRCASALQPALRARAWRRAREQRSGHVEGLDRAPDRLDRGRRRFLRAGAHRGHADGAERQRLPPDHGRRGRDLRARARGAGRSARCGRFRSASRSASVPGWRASLSRWRRLRRRFRRRRCFPSCC